MNDFGKYYEIKQNLEFCKYRIERNSKNEKFQKELENDKKELIRLSEDFRLINDKLLSPNADADEKRISLLSVANHIIKEISLITKNGIFFPDQRQGMIIPGYLFGMIINEFRVTLNLDGGYPCNHIYMSNITWDVDHFNSVLENIQLKLQETKFENYIQAVDFFESEIKDSILNFISELQNKGQLY